MTIWFFEPPVIEEGIQPWETIENQGGKWDHRLMLRFFRLRRGYSVWLDAFSAWNINRFPTFDDVNAAQLFYYGGKISVVDDATRTAIIAAGLSPTVDASNFTVAPADTMLTPPPVGGNNFPITPPSDT